ncbi:MAG: twin-arginine translocase TatA/TatE family subunit [Candidatus Limnocylindrales bacterium]
MAVRPPHEEAPTMPFNIQGPELIVLLVIALLVLGPGKLPEVGSALGKSIREFRKAATDVKEAASLEPLTPPAESARVEATRVEATRVDAPPPSAPAWTAPPVEPAPAVIPAPSSVDTDSPAS